MTKWAMVPLGDVLTRRKEEVGVVDFETYKRLTIRLNGNGIVVRDQLLGSDIGTKKQFRVHTGQLVLSKIDARNGAFGVLPSDGDDAIITGNFWAFDHEPDRLDIRFMEYLTKTAAFVDLCVAASEGTTNRLYLQEDLFLQMEIPLPALKEQQQIVEWIDDAAERVEQANYEADSAVKRLDNLLMSAFHAITEGVSHRPLEEIAPLTRRPAAIDPTAEYPGISTRSFGRGTFHNPPLLGSEITWQKPYEVKAGDILVSNIKAWEGAIAVVSPEDDGRFGSHRYLTFACKEGVATPRYVCFYLLSPEGLFHVGEASPGSADRNRTTGSKAMQGIPVPVPTYERQLWFDQLYEKVETAKKVMTQAGEERNAILPSVLNQVFGGEE